MIFQITPFESATCSCIRVG